MPTETALITGASAGIGWELAKLFARDRSNLILVARRRERLEELAESLRREYGVDVRVLAKDLADPAAPREIFAELEAEGLAVDVLVNNAGFGAHGWFAELPEELQVEMVQVNVAALTHLTRLFLPGMMARGRGGILNVGSTAGFQAGPRMAVYFASKAYVLSLSEALADELSGTPIRVSCLAPGPVNTEFAAVAKMEKSPLLRMWPLTAEAAARAGYRGLRRGKIRVVPGLSNRLGVLLVRFAPRALVRRVVRGLNG